MYNSNKKTYFRYIFLWLISFFIILGYQNAGAKKGEKVSKNPNDWYYQKIGPRHIDMWGNKFTQTEYIFQNSDNPPCIDDCPYKFPFWDGSINSVNRVLRYIGLPGINNLIKTNDKSGRQYTDPAYPQGEIIIFKGKYFDHFWKVIIRER